MFVIARSRIADYETWKRAFDAEVDTRIRHGARGHYVYRAEHDDRKLTVMIEVASHGGAEGLMRYDLAHRRAMGHGHPQHDPPGGNWRIDYVDEVDAALYVQAGLQLASARST